MNITQLWTKFILPKKSQSYLQKEPDVHEKAKDMVLRVSRESETRFFIDRMKLYDTGLYVHCLNVAVTSAKMAYKLGMKEWFIRQIVKGALLHDYGKIFIAKEILNAPRKLNKDELRLIRMHSVYGHSLISGLGYSEIVEDIVLHHHEDERGKGYPDASTDMSFETKLVSFADKYDALVTYRPYNRIFTKEEAIEELMKFKDNFTEGEFFIGLIATIECPDTYEYSRETGLRRKEAEKK